MLCFGWIDSTVKLIDKDRFAQRFTPRKPTSKLSAMNKERIRRLTRQKKMTAAGVAAVKHLRRGASPATQADDLGRAGAIIAPDVLQALRADKQIWRNFRKFPASYKRIRLGWVEGARNRPEIFRKRLAYFLEMTAKNTRFGMVQ